MMLESREKAFALGPPWMCHIVRKADDHSIENDENNITHDFHNAFDGLQVRPLRPNDDTVRTSGA
jgi:hypothetical protein